MKKRTWNPVESPKALYPIALIACAGLGLPLSIALLLESGGDWYKIAVAAIPVPFCTVIGFLLLRIIFWLAPASEEEQGGE